LQDLECQGIKGPRKARVKFKKRPLIAFADQFNQGGVGVYGTFLGRHEMEPGSGSRFFNRRIVKRREQKQKSSVGKRI
jgi:hypothetical protein